MTDPAAVTPAPVQPRLGYPSTPMGLPAYPAPPMGCCMCGSVPAADVTFRRHTGMILLMRFSSNSGPFCRDCGLYVFRKATAYTLLAGWWGWLSFVITPITVIVNLVRRRSVAALAAPRNPAPGRQPANPGKPLYQRFAIAGLLVPVLVVGVIVAAALSPSGDDTAVGTCIRTSADGSQASVVDCSAQHDGVVTRVADSSADCPSSSIAVLRHDDGSDDTRVLCIGEG